MERHAGAGGVVAFATPCHRGTMDNAEIRRTNLRALVDEHGTAAVAERIGVSRSQLSQIAGRNPSRAIGISLAKRIETAFDKPRGWLDVLHDLTNVGAAHSGGKRVPVISYTQAGAPTQVYDAHEPGQGFDEIYTDLPLGPNAFALEIRGDSMAPDFTEGDRVIIDPAVRPQPGDFVVARINHIEATFKKYRPRGIGAGGKDIFELVPLNEDYATLRSDQVKIEIVGTMVEHRRYRRKR